MPEPIKPPSENPNARDAAIVSRLVDGDSGALRQLLQAYGGVVKSRLRKDFGTALDDSELDEAMSAMAIKVWNAAARFDATKGTLRAWVLVIARNSALRLLEQRRRARLQVEPDMDRWPTLELDVTPSSEAERARVMADLRGCVEQLPPMQRTILEADLAAGESAAAEALAQRLCTTTNSIYVSRQKARSTVRRLMAAHGHWVDHRTAPAADGTEPEPPVEMA